MSFPKKIGVVGVGYVGLPLLMRFVDQGAIVVGYDTNQRLCEELNSGKSRIPDVPNEDLVKAISKKLVSFSSNPISLSSCDVIVVCVPTPLGKNSDIDISLLKSAVDSISLVAPDQCLIINESTSYPGTLREIFSVTFKEKRRNSKFYLATAPERIDPGNSIPIEDIPRVVGGIDQESTDKAAEFYGLFFNKIHKVSTPEVAEVSKLLENTFRQVNISLVNELNDLCRDLGIDTREAIEAASTKPYGFMRFTPSAGIGGHCIPVDPEYLQFFARKSGKNMNMISAATSVNNSLAERITRRVTTRFGLTKVKSGIILGVAYKPNIPDCRDTPALAIKRSFQELGISIDWHDPLVMQWDDETSTEIGNGQWDFGLIVTGHDALDLKSIKQRCGVVFDLTGRFISDHEIVQI